MKELYTTAAMSSEESPLAKRPRRRCLSAPWKSSHNPMPIPSKTPGSLGRIRLDPLDHFKPEDREAMWDALGSSNQKDCEPKETEL
jgi:hypothetical protein